MYVLLQTHRFIFNHFSFFTHCCVAAKFCYYTLFLSSLFTRNVPGTTLLGLEALLGMYIHICCFGGAFKECSKNHFLNQRAWVEYIARASRSYVWFSCNVVFSELGKIGENFHFHSHNLAQRSRSRCWGSANPPPWPIFHATIQITFDMIAEEHVAVSNSPIKIRPHDPTKIR